MFPRTAQWTQSMMCVTQHLCPRSCGPCQELSLWVPFSWRWAPEEGTGWQVASRRLAAPPREGAYGPPCVTGAGLDAFGLRGRRNVLKARLFSSARAAGNWLGGSVGATSGSRTDAEIRCDWWASEHPFLLPLPSLASRLLTTLSLPHTGRAPLIRWKEGRKEVELSIFPSWHCSAHLPAGSLLEQMTLVFLRCYSKGCTIYQQFFLLT